MGLVAKQMVDKTISFGTDGWRDIIADNYTFQNVMVASKAVADYVLSQNSEPHLIVGYDTRFMSEKFALRVAEVLASEGIRVTLSNKYVTTPMVSAATCNLKADGGIVITASHNPAKYNGFKFKAPYGGSANPKIMAEIEKSYIFNLETGAEPKTIDLKQGEERGLVNYMDLSKDYDRLIMSLLNKEIFDKGQLKILVDPLYGAGQGYLKELLISLGCSVDEIHGRILPTFGGVNPEPIESNLGDLRNAIVEGDYDLGLALDGDADRIGAVDERGDFVDSHKIFSLVLKHLAEEKKWRGKVVKTVSTTQMVDRLARKFNLPLIETPIGFKYICDHILTDDVLIGGEESGGISIKGHIPERDGLLMGCMIAEVMLSKGKTLSELIEDLHNEVGPTFYRRMDVEIEGVNKERMIKILGSQDLGQAGGRTVRSKNFKDGFKYFFENDNWLLIRPSGTEPVVRIYAEADNESEVELLMTIGDDLLKKASKE